jgi:hypothetical protein
MKHVKILSDCWRFSPFYKNRITYLRQRNHTLVLHSSSSFVKSSRSQTVKIVCRIQLWYLLWCSPLKQIWTNISRNLPLTFIVKKSFWPFLARILKKITYLQTWFTVPKASMGQRLTGETSQLCLIPLSFFFSKTGQLKQLYVWYCTNELYIQLYVCLPPYIDIIHKILCCDFISKNLNMLHNI